MGFQRQSKWFTCRRRGQCWACARDSCQRPSCQGVVPWSGLRAGHQGRNGSPEPSAMRPAAANCPLLRGVVPSKFSHPPIPASGRFLGPAGGCRLALPYAVARRDRQPFIRRPPPHGWRAKSRPGACIHGNVSLVKASYPVESLAFPACQRQPFSSWPLSVTLSQAA